MKRLGLMLLSALCLAFAGTGADAQTKYPTKPVRILVPYAPGGATDIVARILGEQLRQILGEAFVVDNKPGAFGILAIQEMARAKPDGYTLMVGNVSTNAITPVIFPKKFSISYEKSVVPVMRLVDLPEFLLATTKNFPVKTAPELIEAAKQKPGTIRYGSVGVGSYPHYDMALFAKRAGGLDMIHVPNKAGASGVINDMISGDVQTAFLNVASTAPMIRAGQLRALAIVNPKRLPDHPDVPTMEEVGFKGVGTMAWQALFAPAGTPREVLDTLHKAVVQALQAPSVVQTFEKQDFNIVPSKSVDEAATWLKGEMDAWKQITQEVPIEVTE